MPVKSIFPFIVVHGTKCALSPNQGISNLETLHCMMNNKTYLFSSTSTAQFSLAAIGLFILVSPAFWGEYVAMDFFFCLETSRFPCPCRCFHTAFSEVWGSEKLVQKVSGKKLIANCSFLRPGKVKSGRWWSWQDTQQWNNFSWSKWVLWLLLCSHYNWAKVFSPHLHPGAVTVAGIWWWRGTHSGLCAALVSSGKAWRGARCTMETGGESRARAPGCPPAWGTQLQPRGRGEKDTRE